MGATAARARPAIEWRPREREVTMSDSEDLKDQVEGAPQPEAPEKRPLGFEQSVAPPAANLTDRRLFLKLSLLGAAASLLPAAVHAALPGGGDLTPVALPYRNSLSFKDLPGVLSDRDGAQSNYSLTGSGDLYIDAGGNIFLSNVNASGVYVSGDLNEGKISAVQPMASMAGKYSGTTVDASTTVLYSDANVKQQPATLRLNGTLAKGYSDLSLGVDFRISVGTGPDIGIVATWRRTICC